MCEIPENSSIDLKKKKVCRCASMTFASMFSWFHFPFKLILLKKIKMGALGLHLWLWACSKRCKTFPNYCYPLIHKYYEKASIWWHFSLTGLFVAWFFNSYNPNPTLPGDIFGYRLMIWGHAIYLPVLILSTFLAISEGKYKCCCNTLLNHKCHW